MNFIDRICWNTAGKIISFYVTQCAAKGQQASRTQAPGIVWRAASEPVETRKLNDGEMRDVCGKANGCAVILAQNAIAPGVVDVVFGWGVLADRWTRSLYKFEWCIDDDGETAVTAWTANTAHLDLIDGQFCVMRLKGGNPPPKVGQLVKWSVDLFDADAREGAANKMEILH
jgi:hypothetical protein